MIVNSPQINDVLCGQNDSARCSGYLQRWVIGGFDGIFESIRDHIVDGTVEDLINEVNDFTNINTVTASSLVTIRNYMNVNPGQNVYRQICDLEGVFLQNGVFQVNDVEAIERGVAISTVTDIIL